MGGDRRREGLDFALEIHVAGSRRKALVLNVERFAWLGFKSTSSSTAESSGSRHLRLRTACDRGLPRLPVVAVPVPRHKGGNHLGNIANALAALRALC